jgi:4a-hydroxytetrahydrobiopterin dehydratase
MKQKDNQPLNLAAQSCVPCQGGIPPLKGTELARLGQGVPQWQVVDEHHLTRIFTFVDFKSALSFVNPLAALAEREGHHPDLHLSWGRVKVDIWTHKIDGLTESDFILAAKLDRVHTDSLSV